MKVKTAGLMMTGLIWLGMTAMVSAADVTATKGPAGVFNETLFPASNRDLVNAGQASLSSVTTTGTIYGQLVNSNDGTLFNGTPSSSDPHYTGFAMGGTLTFYLNTSVNTHGYDIQTFKSVTGWYVEQRTGQHYTLAMRPLGGAFTNVATVSANPFDPNGGLGGMQQVTVSGNNGALLATGVDAIRLTFNSWSYTPPGYSTWSNYPEYYREFDVTGTATPLTETAALSGTVVLGDSTGDNDSTPVPVAARIELRQGSNVMVQNKILGAGGSFITDNVTPGTYDVAVKAYAHLQKVVYGVVIAGATTLSSPIVMVSGDNDGDNAVTSADLLVVLANLDTTDQ